MAITHNTTLRNTMADAVAAGVDSGAGAGQLIFKASGGAEVATLTMSDPAFGAASNGVITANSITDDSSVTGGEAVQFDLVNSTGTVQLSGSVGVSGSGADIILGTTTIPEGVRLSITSFTYTAAP